MNFPVLLWSLAAKILNDTRFQSPISVLIFSYHELNKRLDFGRQSLSVATVTRKTPKNSIGIKLTIDFWDKKVPHIR